MDKAEVVSAPIPLMKCRFCKGDHWSMKCTLKDILQDKIETNVKETPAASAAQAGAGKSTYVPPSMRSGAAGAKFTGSKFDSGKSGFNNKGQQSCSVSAY